MEHTYTGQAISLTRSVRPFFLLIGLATITGLFIYSDGWATITKWFLASTVLVLIFCIWFPYSPFVKIQLRVEDEKIFVGKDVLLAQQITKIVNQGEGLTIQFHMPDLQEPLQVRMDNDYQRDASEFLEKWAAQHDVPYTVEKG